MRIGLVIGVVLCMAAVVAVACGDIQVADGYRVSSLGQNFMGGFDYLPNGDIIGMYADPLFAVNSYVGIIDANGDGLPVGLDKKYDFSMPVWAGFVKVSPDGTFALFAETTSYKLYSMNLSNYEVHEVVPASGSLDGAYDLAFIDSAACYISANPAWGTTNKIYRLDIATRMLTEAISVSPTYSGPVDVDNAGNLYYVKGNANFPPQAGDFSVLEFEAAKLSAALAGGKVLGLADGAMVAAGLDGGYDVAWLSSGELYVSDCNNGKVYKVPPSGTISQFLSQPGKFSEGFRVISIYGRDQSFDPRTNTKTEMSVDYLPLPGAAQPDLYRVQSLVPGIKAIINGTRFPAQSRLVITVVAQPTSVASDAYVVFLGPEGIAYSVTPQGLREGIQAYARKLPPLQSEVVARVVDLTIPDGVRAGVWTVCVALMPQGTKPSVAKALALDSSEIILE